MKSVNTDVAYNYVRKKILSGEYPPGHALLTESLATEIGLSRTPVRDAFRKLETDGLVTVRARLGASVKKMDVQEFREMCDLRLALECHAAARAAGNHTDADLHEIHVPLEAMRRLTARILQAPQEQPLLGELMLEDVRFHIAIMTAARNEFMKREILRLHLINRVVASAPGGDQRPVQKTDSDARRRVVLSHHDEIYAAIAASDPMRARTAMESHLQEMIDHNLLLMTRAETGVIAREFTAEEVAFGT